MKTIAMYLPQFHRTPENDEWWGEGFTEWTAVKRAEVLFEGQNQPRKPLNGNYYNLLDKSTMEWQAGLAKEYGIDGFCFYHYYFKDGRKILEKPAENLLGWKDIDMPFCFCWANETWARTWSNVGDKNSWGDKFEQKNVKKESADTGILLPQVYGQEQEWKDHFYYLLPFLKDERYIKCGDRPVFVIYKPEQIYCLQRMITYWKELAKIENIPEIYIVGINVNHKMKGLDSILWLGPRSFRDIECTNRTVPLYKKDGVSINNYRDFWEAGLNAKQVDGCPTYFSAVVGFDDTPRRGKSGLCIEDATPELFEEYFYKLLKLSAKLENEFVFINAWNEWGEGMYLEPDLTHGYAYLNAVKNCLEKLKTYDASQEMSIGTESTEVNAMRQQVRKYRGYFQLLNEWMKLKEQKKGLEKYFTDYHMDYIAIYGWADLGKHLYQELNESGISVKYLVEQHGSVENGVLSIEEFAKKSGEVSGVVVTATYDYNAIYEALEGKVDCPIISLEEVVYSISNS